MGQTLKLRTLQQSVGPGQAAIPADGPLTTRALARLVSLDRAEDQARNAFRNGTKWQTHPVDVLPAWIADMDFGIAGPIQNALREAVERSDLGYPIGSQKTPLPAVVAKRMATRFGWCVEPHRMEFVADVLQGVSIAITQFTSPGDGVLLLVPSYPHLRIAVQELGRRLEQVPLSLTNDGYVLDIDRLVKAIDPRTRMLVLCNPQNPTGRVFTRAELEAIGNVALRHNLTIVSDEVHQDLVFAGQHLPIAALDAELAARTITITSASKAFNLGGLGCGVTLFGSDAQQRQFNQFPSRYRGHSSTLSLVAAQAAWGNPESQRWLDATLHQLRANRDKVVDFVHATNPGIRMFCPEATYLAWLDCRELDLQTPPEEFFREHARVALSGGPSFGPGAEGHVRLNFATQPEILDDVLARLSRSLPGVRSRPALRAVAPAPVMETTAGQIHPSRIWTAVIGKLDPRLSSWLEGQKLPFKTFCDPHSANVARNLALKTFLEETDQEYLLCFDGDQIPNTDTTILLDTGEGLAYSGYPSRTIAGRGHFGACDFGSGCFRVTRTALLAMREKLKILNKGLNESLAGIDYPIRGTFEIGWFYRPVTDEGSNEFHCPCEWFHGLARSAGYPATMLGTIGHAVSDSKVIVLEPEHTPFVTSWS